MKSRPDRSRLSSDFDADRFIQGATADVATVKRTRAESSSRSHLPAEGTVRRSFDLPKPLFRQLKLTAARHDRSMREIVLEALSEWIDARQGS